MTTAIRTTELTKRYGRRTALSGCTLDVPAGHVVGLVGPNGAGKSTLLQLTCALLNPTAGRVEVLGEPPVSGSPRIGFVAQDTPIYRSMSVADHLRMGRHLNPAWDDALARDRIDRLGLDPAQRGGASPAGSGPSWRSRWPSPSGPSCSFSTSRWPRSTRSPAASSSGR
jgi:ABC-2 type transport system ATP-binding protein